MAYIVMAYVFMADIVIELYSYGTVVMAYTFMAYTVMELYSHGLYSYGTIWLWNYIVIELYSYGLHSHGLYSYGLSIYGLQLTREVAAQRLQLDQVLRQVGAKFLPIRLWPA